MTEPDDTCRPVEIDGELIRVRGAEEMSDEAREALGELIRVAKEKFAAEHPARHTADTITDDELDQLYAERDMLRRNLRRALDTAEAANARATSAETASQRLMEQRQEMAEERYAWQQRGDQAEDAIARVVAITEEHPAGIDTALILAALDTPEALDEPCGQHPTAPRIGGMCGGCTQYPSDMPQEHRP